MHCRSLQVPAAGADHEGAAYGQLRLRGAADLVDGVAPAAVGLAVAAQVGHAVRDDAVRVAPRAVLVLALAVGLSRTVGSEKELPNMFVDLV